jgi:regulator of ribonuclease activity A
VIVVDGGGSLRRALLGDQLAEKAVLNGWLGIIINGAVRDVEILATLPLGILALGVIPFKTDKRDVGLQGLPIEIGGTEISEGDWIYADASGVVVSPRNLMDH